MRRAIASIGLIVLLCIVASGCFKMNGGTLEEAQVRAVFDKYEQGAVTGNSEQVASCYAAEFEVIDSNGPVDLVTREELKEAWDRLFDAIHYTRYSFTGLAITFNDKLDEAVVEGQVILRGYAKGKDQKWLDNTVVGRWTFRRFSGQWLIVREERFG